MKIKEMGGFLRFLTGGWAAAITLAPFGIYVLKEYLNYKWIINHESIHWKQQMEMLILPFYIWYVLEWFIKLFIYGKKSYYNISFEREASVNEKDLEYLHKRKHYSWFKLII